MIYTLELTKEELAWLLDVLDDAGLPYGGEAILEKVQRLMEGR